MRQNNVGSLAPRRPRVRLIAKMRNSAIAEYVLAKVAYGMDYAKIAVLPSTSEYQLAQIYLLLRQVFPPETDPPSSKSETATPRQSVVQFRANLIGALTARGNDDSCRELMRLFQKKPNFQRQ